MARRRRPIRVPIVPDSPEWHALRREGLGASDAPIVAGDAPRSWGDPDDLRRTLYAEKLGHAARPVANRAMDLGKRLEPVVAAWYAEAQGVRLRDPRSLFIHPDPALRFMRATPDRLGRGRVVELKVVADSDEWGRPGTAEVPDHYAEQVQHQAEVLDVEVVDIAVLFLTSRRFERYIVPRDRALVDALLELEGEFMRHVETRTPPLPIGTRAAPLVLRADEVVADEDLAETVLELRAVQDELKVLAKAEELLKGRIREQLVDVGGARGDGFRVHYRPQGDRTGTDWQLVAGAFRQRLEQAGTPPDELERLVADYTASKPGPRPLLVTFPKEKARNVA